MARPEAAVGPEAPTGDDLFALLRELRELRNPDLTFTIGIREHVLVQELAAACFADAGVDATRLRNWLAPVLCHSPAQQEHFYRVYKAWWSRRPSVGKQPRKAGAATDESVVSKSRPWKWVGVFAGLVALGLAGMYLHRRVSHRPIQDGTPSPMPVESVEVKVPAPAQWPDLVGLASEEAIRRLTELGVGHEIAGREPSDRPEGTVLRQEPAAGTALPAKPAQPPTIRLWVAAPARPRNVLEVTVHAEDLEGRPVEGASIQKVVRLAGVSGRTLFAVFRPDGTRVLTDSENGTAQSWDAASGDPVLSLEHSGVVYDAGRSVTFNSDGSRILTASERGTSGRVGVASFTTDRTRVVALDNGRAQVFDVATGQPSGPALSTGDNTLAVAFNTDGTRIVTGTDAGWVDVWDAATKQRVRPPFEHGGKVYAASFSADGTRIVTGSDDGTVRIWDATTGLLLAAPLQHQSAVIGASFDPASTHIVTLEASGAVHIWDMSSLVYTDARGDARLTWQPPKAWSLAVGHDAYAPAQPFEGDQGPGYMTLRATLSPKASPSNEWITDNLGWIRVFAAVVPILAALCWCAWSFQRRRLVLERRASQKTQDLAHVPLAEPQHHLYRGPGFTRARIEARRRQAGGGGDLDVDATVDRTIQKLGFFSPVLRPRSRLPAYLALVDRASFRDQQARVVEEFLNGLREGGVAVDSYFFDRDPRLCAPSHGADGTYRSLWELSAMHAEHRLLVFGDASGLADPVTGKPAAWTHGFSPWSERALLTPVPACHWSAHEVELAGAGFRVVPFTSAGLHLFVESLQPSALRPALLEWHAPYPPLLSEQPGRWLERRRPRPEELDLLCWQLRAYLGLDGFRWLAALATYPELDWFLTLSMGLGLHGPLGLPLLDEEPLLALSRLPWLRHGHMPDWLRLRLVAELGEEDARTVRALLHDLMRARLDPAGSRFKLDLARPSEDTEGRRWRRFFTDLLRTEPSDSPLQDYVFVEFLLGRRPKRLQVPAPRGWRRWVYHRGLHALGVTPAVVVAGALLVAAAANLGARPLADMMRGTEPQMPSSMITQTDWTAMQGVTVPNVVGRKVADASTALTGAHLRVGWLTSTFARSGDIVTAQLPEAGGFVGTGTAIELRTAAMPEWKLLSVSGALQIVGFPAGASPQRLSIDGVPWTGQNPILLRAGTHGIAFDAGQMVPVTRTVTVTAGATTQFTMPANTVPAPIRVTSAGPTSGVQGQTVRLTIHGSGLSRVGSVQIEGTGLTLERLTYAPDGTQVSPFDEGTILVSVAIAADASTEPRAIRLLDAYGRVLQRLRQTFEVSPKGGGVVGGTVGFWGTATDVGTGKPLSGITVVVTGPDGSVNETMVTNAEGMYASRSLPPGRYTIRAERVGFLPATHENVALEAGAPVRLDLKLLLRASVLAEVPQRLVLDSIEVKEDGSPSATKWEFRIEVAGGGGITLKSWKYDDGQPALRFQRSTCTEVKASPDGSVTLQIIGTRPDKGDQAVSERVTLTGSGAHAINVVSPKVPKDGSFVFHVTTGGLTRVSCQNEVAVESALAKSQASPPR